MIDTVNPIESKIQSIVDGTGKEIVDENSNKNSSTIAVQRDLFAGEVSKEIGAKKYFPKEVLDAHEKGIIHIHDLDYAISPGMMNCCLPNFKDMLTNGTVINGVAIEPPHSFQVACTVFTQIIACISSSQYGGQSANNFPEILAPFVERSREKTRAFLRDLPLYAHAGEDEINEAAEKMVEKEIADGLQTIQYQINTLMGSNGQSPFLTLFLNFDPNGSHAGDCALIVEETLRQRIKGVKNERGVSITPTFPKLIYVLDEHNIHEDSPYYYLTELAAECTAKRMYPDYISAKLMRENYGSVFSPMGCRSFLPPYVNDQGEPQYEGRFNKGVVTINLPNVALSTESRDEDEFFTELEDRLERYVFPALVSRHNFVAAGSTSSSPTHWCYGAIARLPLGVAIPDKYLTGKYSTLSLGYLGMEEACRCITGMSHTTERGRDFSLKIMRCLNDAANRWNEKHDYGFSVYGTPAESLTSKACSKDVGTFGIVEDVNDREFYTNSYHVHVEEKINVFDKFSFESEFQKLSQGGCISYCELGDMSDNIEAMLSLVKYGYDTIQYFEFNLRGLDLCSLCDYEGEAVLNTGSGEWECPQCGNDSRDSLYVIRRSCGYLGSQRWINGRAREISNRVIHI